ncbi:DUF6414 family protein [Priestia megaterium]|uniref:DUF6414 family protein n=1 Tax=Priestia megaterium TaxID=1404 RepID=UPI000C803769|nr:hypothetical protein [Priestia megaterium]PMD07599.1 hypothetical protein CJ194_23650 [Priestia megaterium]
MFKLRDFLYLDERTVKRYLSSIEEGLVKEVLQTNIDQKPNWQFDVSLGDIQKLLAAAGVPIPNVGVKRNGKTGTLSVQITKEPTIDSQFDKLFKYIEPALQYLEGFDPAIWSQLEDGQFVYYSSEVSLPNGYKNAQTLSIGAEFYELAKGWVDRDDEFEKVIEESKGYREEVASKKFTNVYSLPLGSPNKRKYYFVAKIIHDNLVDSSLEELTMGSAFTLARVEHILQANDRYTVFDSTLKGVDRIMNREERRKQKNDLFDIATKPAVIVRPIAIFRE